MVLEYAEVGDFNYWMSNNRELLIWSQKLAVLSDIIEGLKAIHEKNMVHRDFHTGNILFEDTYFVNNSVYISDMGLCGEVSNTDATKIYGVISYVAPEVLKGKPYTQAADIYSFGMIMYFVATGMQPFADHGDYSLLALGICNGNRPGINEPEAPKCYIELMMKCWNPNPD